MQRCMFFRFVLIVFTVFASASSTRAGDDRYFLRPESLATELSSPFSVSILLDSQPGTLGSPDLVQSVSYGVCHDPSMLEIVNVQLGSAITSLLGAEQPYFSATIHDPDSGFAVGLIIDVPDMAGESFDLLPGGVDLELHEANYAPLVTTEGTTVLNICDTISASAGSPPVEVVFSVDPMAAYEVVPNLAFGEIELVVPATASFIRGDSNQDGTPDIADAIRLIEVLFQPTGIAAPLACEDAADANDDGAVDTSDVVATLQALFGPSTVPLPGPASCGGDTSDGDTLDCDNPTCP